MADRFAEDYIDVATRIVEFRAKHPEGSLQPANPDKPFELVEIGGITFIVYGAAAYRTPDDARPGIGYAYEQVPGRTPYTRGSELQNAETSAWGRAIVAALAADTKKGGIASADEIRNRQAERDEPTTDPEWLKQMEAAIADASDAAALDAVAATIRNEERFGRVAREHGEHLLHLFQQRQAEITGKAAGQQAAPANGQPSAPARTVSQAMLTKLHTLFTRLGVTDRDEGQMTIRILTGEEVTTSKDLTYAGAKGLIDRLEWAIQQPDARKALDDLIQAEFAKRGEEPHDHAA